MECFAEKQALCFNTTKICNVFISRHNAILSDHCCKGIEPAHILLCLRASVMIMAR